MPSPIIPILLAGGAGTRLWPVSRDALPKQFLPLVGERSTYQETLLRVADPMFGAPIVITGPNFHFFARRQAEEVGVDATVVIEPLRRDSAPAIAAATAVALARDPNAVVLALAADHIILDVENFRATCLAGREAADAGKIVTFGIKPTEPKTSYGYILPGEAVGSSGREAGCRDRRPLRPRRLSVEFRQLPVSRRCPARRDQTDGA
jgi:mannose-1-phosphate guanylyltransferase / mannose-6-phosphate isomerase